MRSKYTEEDKSIIKQKKRRELLINLLRERAIGYLMAEKLTSESIIESTLRPKGVLTKYKELIREAARDEKTLIYLENQLNSISLEAAKNETPWELITKPTLLKYPVAPNTKKIVLELIKQVSKNKTTVIVTHDSDTKNISDQIFELNK